MKRIIALLFIVQIAIINSHGQIAYHDAITLSDSSNNNGIIKGKVIIRSNPKQLKYLAHYAGSDTIDVLLKAFKENPFIEIAMEDTGFVEEDRNTVGYSKQLGSSVAGLEVSDFAMGLAGFIKDRAIEELNIVFFEKFDKFLKDEKYPEIRILFPNTCNTIKGLLGYQYPQMLPALQKAFQTDMESIPNNLTSVLYLPKYYNENFPELLLVAKLFEFYNDLQLQKLSAIDYLDNLDSMIYSISNIEEFKNNEVIQNISTVVKFIKVLSNSLRTDSSENTGRNWVSSKDFYKKILSDSNTKQIYLGLIYQQIKDLKINGKTITNYISEKKIEEEIKWYNDQLSQLIIQFEQIDVAKKNININKSEHKTPNASDVHSYINLTLGLFSSGVDLASHYNVSVKENYAIKIVNNSYNIYNNIYSKQYNKAIDNALDILTFIDYAYRDKNDGKILINEKFLKGLNRYGKFIGYVAVAETSQDVQDAINGIALPPGSASIKKHSDFTIEIGSYLGVAYNIPFRKINENETSVTWNRPLTLTAPVGVNFSFSTKNNRSLTAFVSILDVGAIVDYQLTDTTHNSANIEQKIYLGNILSPGAYFVIGAKKYPFSMGFGAQYGPSLISYKGDNGIEINKPSIRVNITLTMDIPIITLKNNAGKAYAYKSKK